MLTPSEQQLFKRITRLTLLLGILVGFCIILLGVMIYDVLIASRRGFHIANPGVDELLLPFVFILQGAAYTLWWRVQILRSRFLGFQHDTKSESFNRQRGLLGLFIICLSCFMLISIAADLPSGVVEPILAVGSIGGICLFLGFDSYLSHRAARRRGQH